MTVAMLPRSAPCSSLLTITLPFPFSHTPSIFIVFEAQERRESLVGVAVRPRRRSSSPSTFRTSLSSTVHAIVFHDSQAPSSTHSCIPANPTVRFRP